MSQEDIVVELQKREIVRKGLNGLRSSGVTPAVIHNHGKDSIHVMGDTMALGKVYKQAGKHHAVHLKVAGEDHLALIKNVAFEPKKNGIQHIVFQAIDKDKKVETEVPVILMGEIPAEKAGLMVITNITNVFVQALPSDLPDQLTVDASKLAEIGDKLHVSDIVLPSGVTVVTEPETTLAVVEETKAQMSEESAEEETAEGEEGETTEEAASEQDSDKEESNN